ncbi:hypothetical protein PFNF135_02947 [Plasmodium falciparum NF135/5.C10]|uniref:Uncharacterized protein n=1 Tax=Plasmodium falciparum NF135/5.C10 TaxID=1036726 RepID=W4IHV7_PLAFA|nr:hypothetical protein PFNF135_02947 [Plasmodium falciparum NF135/5.C10]
MDFKNAECIWDALNDLHKNDKENINMKSNCNVENYYYMENTNKLKNKMNSYRNLICKI